MEAHRALGRLSESDLAEVCDAATGVLVLTRMSCGRCDVYQADIERMMAKGGFDGIPIGKLIVDEAGPSNVWAQAIAGLDERRLPVTIIYQEGQEVDQFCTTRAAYLLRRIADLTSSSISMPSGADSFRGDEDDRD